MESLRHIDNKPIEHIERDVYHSWHYTERVKEVLNGTSKRRRGFTQDEVATLFVHDYDCESGTGNFRSKQGVLWHYRTVEALKTVNGLIINNRNCWSRGFARCATPPLVNYALDLSIFPFNAETLRTLEIIDHKDTSQSERSATLVKIDEAYFLNAYDDSGAFVAELYGKPRNVKEAFDSMKPKIVKLSENMGLKVKRQGELFFIPTDVKTSQVLDVQKRTRTKCTRFYFQCEKCGLKTKSVVVKTDSDRYHGYHPKAEYWSAPPSWTKEQIKCAEDHGHYDEKDMKAVFYNGYQYSEFPQITYRDVKGRPLETRHTATKLGKYLEVREHGKTYAVQFDFTVAKGIVRHPQHQALKLGEKWHIIAHNTVKRAWSRVVGRD